MRFRFSEALSGGVSSRCGGGAVQPFALELEISGRGLRESLLGAPLAAMGALRAESCAADVLLPPRGVVTGTLRFLVGSGLFYDLRVAPRDGAPASEQLSLRGARRFVRGDLFTSATTFDGVLVRGGVEVGDVRLRFDARDDVPRLVRSLRLG